MKASDIVLYFFSIILLVTGCSKQMSFIELTKGIPTDCYTRSYSRKTMKYSISVPKRFELRDKDYNDESSFELFLDTSGAFYEGVSMLSVIKYDVKDVNTSLDIAWQNLMSNRVMIEDFRIYSEGLTNFLSMPAYYEHSACTISQKDTESISFLFRGDSSSFFGISLQVITEDGYPDNMQELLYCAKSFQLLHE